MYKYRIIFPSSSDGRASDCGTDEPKALKFKFNQNVGGSIPSLEANKSFRSFNKPCLAAWLGQAGITAKWYAAIGVNTYCNEVKIHP